MCARVHAPCATVSATAARVGKGAQIAQVDFRTTRGSHPPLLHKLTTGYGSISAQPNTSNIPSCSVLPRSRLQLPARSAPFHQAHARGQRVLSTPTTPHHSILSCDPGCPATSFCGAPTVELPPGRGAHCPALVCKARVGRPTKRHACPVSVYMAAHRRKGSAMSSYERPALHQHHMGRHGRRVRGRRRRRREE